MSERRTVWVVFEHSDVETDDGLFYEERTIYKVYADEVRARTCVASTRDLSLSIQECEVEE